MLWDFLVVAMMLKNLITKNLLKIYKKVIPIDTTAELLALQVYLSTYSLKKKKKLFNSPTFRSS